MDKKGDNDFAIEVALVDDSIIVTLPGTHYRIVYRQGFDTWLVASDTCNVNFPFRTPTFRARAWTAGTDKARGARFANVRTPHVNLIGAP